MHFSTKPGVFIVPPRKVPRAGGLEERRFEDAQAITDDDVMVVE
jgi:hypothetical protein